jgi:ABC-type lipoprotein release transport system permease subunit
MAERIKLQEEIIRIANTNAEVEIIIGKQLRCEIELRRQEEKNVLSPKLNAKKNSK